jgi:allantoinase
MAQGPAAVAGLTRKGAIAVGSDADLVVFAPDESWVVEARALHHRHPVTPYDGMTLAGIVRRTYLRGQPVGETPGGRLLCRGHA